MRALTSPSIFPPGPSQPSLTPAQAFRRLVDAGEDRLPLPGSGQTLQRWQRLARIGQQDLALAKLFEGHTDALAILAELQAPPPPAGSRWGTWCAEPPSHRVSAVPLSDRQVRLDGIKAWCSGAASVTHALMSAWLPDRQPCLVAIDLGQAGIEIVDAPWPGVGMARAGTAELRLRGATATLVGEPGDYTRRAGFWQGGAGVAACWWGACAGIATPVRRAAARRDAQSHPHLHAHLGAIDVMLSQSAALLRESAAAIDAAPTQACAALALRARLSVTLAAEDILARVGRALGPGPLCQDPALGQLVADLPVFIQQSHAERDQANLAALLLAPDVNGPREWTLQ